MPISKEEKRQLMLDWSLADRARIRAEEVLAEHARAIFLKMGRGPFHFNGTAWYMRSKASPKKRGERIYYLVAYNIEEESNL